MVVADTNEHTLTLYHGGMVFTLVKDAFQHGESYIGYYTDHTGERQRVLRDSVYGAQMSALINNKTVEEILMSETAVYDYKISIYDEQGRFMCAVNETVYVERTKFPEEDSGNAVLQAYNLADAYLEEYGGEEYTVQLTDVG